MLYMIIERFKSSDPVPVYTRFRQHGRLMPEGLTYVSSWTSKDLSHCYQLMETGDRKLLEEWIGNWRDLVDFEAVEVMGSSEASAAVLAMTENGGGKDGY
ncbi:hypothetical protein EJ04DRAFT_562254 [Polyplosphaeria fusca]|uniref:DUF3303 domain-containing protein n=1 Tax=Polyplosphaeria fusca TaxID=682080 RepID=A0A9P4R286_9PLEO|nr:hypothetical protein EJ04DRAFT_562254 [Polyplosphaeria fusca]